MQPRKQMGLLGHLGMGLLGASGPREGAWGRGLAAGLLSDNRARERQKERERQAQMDALRKQEYEMRLQQMQQAEFEKRRARAEEEAQREYFNQALKDPTNMELWAKADPEAFQAAQIKSAFSGPAERKTIKGADGYQYFQDTGERVLPGVQAKPEGGMTPYQSFQAELAMMKERRAQAEFDAEQQEAADEKANEERISKQKEDAWRQQRKQGIDAVDRAIEAAGKWGAAGKELNIPGVSSWKGGNRENLLAELNTIQSAVGLERLISIKEQGGTFGALSTKELGLLTDSLASLSENQGQDNLIANLKRVKALLQQANASSDSGIAVGTVEDGYRFKGGDPSNPDNWVKE